MNQVIGFYLITMAINLGIWMLSMIKYSFKFKEAMRCAIITQIFLTMIIIGTYLITNGI